MPPSDTFFSAGQGPLLSKLWRGSPRTSSLAKVASIPPTEAFFSSSVIQPRPPTPYDRRDARVAFLVTHQFVFMCRNSCALKSCKPAIRFLPAISARHGHFARFKSLLADMDEHTHPQVIAPLLEV